MREAPIRSFTGEPSPIATFANQSLHTACIFIAATCHCKNFHNSALLQLCTLFRACSNWNNITPFTSDSPISLQHNGPSVRPRYLALISKADSKEQTQQMRIALYWQIEQNNEEAFLSPSSFTIYSQRTARESCRRWNTAARLKTTHPQVRSNLPKLSIGIKQPPNV